MAQKTSIHADWLQEAIRRASRSAWVLHVDVRKFFYSIDRTHKKGSP